MSFTPETPLPPEAQRKALRPIPLLIFSSRWLQLPLYIGLIVAQGVYVVLFLKELWHLFAHAFDFSEQQIMLAVLGLIDVVMISNLLVMVIVGGYETFVSRLNLEGHPDQPEWLSHVNASVLKIKLAMAIIGISSIHLLRTFIEAGGLASGKTGYTETGVMWQTIIHTVFILSAIGIAYVDKLSNDSAEHAEKPNRPSRIDGRRVDRQDSGLRQRLIAAVLILAAMTPGAVRPVHAADAAFTQFIASLWPEAQAAGVSRATFDAETKGLEPDYKLPDLILPGRPATGAPSQAEFVQVPADYVKEASIARLAAEGQKLMQKHRAALTEIEKRFGVPSSVVLAIWGRETDYGRYRLPYDTLRVVATQAYVGRRKDQYRGEFILALKILGEGAVTRKDFRSSWAGATGYTQFLPSEYYKHGVDLDGDGRVDIWHSVPDALASAAQQLVNKGWQAGVRWAYEVKAPANVDCTMGVPEVTKPIAEWLRAGFVPVRGQKLSAAEQAQPASLLQVEGIYGPAFLTTKNYFVIKEYNFSDLVCAVRRPSRRPHGEPAAVRNAMVGLDAVALRRCRGHAASSDADRPLQGQARRQGRHADPRGARRVSEAAGAQGRLLAERSGAALHESRRV